ncbi:MAG: radical SAM protein [archaeon]
MNYKEYRDKIRDRSNITFVLKLTNMCDNNCKYCYHKHLMPDPSSSILDYDLYEEALHKVIPYYKSVALHHHGGEPLMLTAEQLGKYFEIATRVKKQYNTSVDLCLQSNLLHLTKEKIDVINKYNVGFSTSYDSKAFNFNREGKQSDWKEKYDFFKQYQIENNRGYDIGFINIITKKTIENKDEVIKDIENNDSLVMSNFMTNFCVRNDDVIVEPGKYYEFIKERFEYQVKNKKLLTPDTYRYLQVLYDKDMGDCHCSHCLNSIHAMTPTGILKGCDMRNEDEFLYCNIKDLDNIKDLFKQEKYLKIEKATYDVYDRCKDCPYVDYCNAGCYNRSMPFYSDNGKYNLSKDAYCYDLKKLFKYFIDYFKCYDNNVYKLPENVKKSLRLRKDDMDV